MAKKQKENDPVFNSETQSRVVKLAKDAVNNRMVEGFELNGKEYRVTTLDELTIAQDEALADVVGAGVMLFAGAERKDMGTLLTALWSTMQQRRLRELLAIVCYPAKAKKWDETKVEEVAKDMAELKNKVAMGALTHFFTNGNGFSTDVSRIFTRG